MKAIGLFILNALLAINLTAHEGHDMPGAMPPAPHGGEVKAAEHEGEDKHDHGGENKHEGEDKHDHAKESGHEDKHDLAKESGHEDKHDHAKEPGHEEKHDHGKEPAHNDKKAPEPEIEVFFEAVYSNKVLKVYPLQLSPKNQKTFVPLATTHFSNVKISIELPRQKKTEEMKVVLADTHYEVAFDPKSAFRFFALVTVQQDGEVKKAKIQVELD